MRKYGLYLLIAISLLSGCQKKSTAADVTAAQETEKESSAAESTGESTVAEETKEGNGESAENKANADLSAPLPIAVKGDYDGEWDDTQTAIITSRCDEVFIQGDGYDALKKAVAAKNAEMLAANKKEYEEYKQDAVDLRKSYPDQKITYVCNYEFEPVRIDGTVASMGWLKYYDLGGAHPNSEREFCTFDTQTGKELAFDDVVKDKDGFLKIVKDELSKRAAEGALFDDYEDTVNRLFDGTDPDYHLEWAVSERGVSVYFAPYAIAPYAEGEIEINVPFRDHTSMFDEKYCGTSVGGWAKKIESWDTVTYKEGDTNEVAYDIYNEDENTGSTKLTIEYDTGETAAEDDDFTKKLTIQKENGGKTDTFTKDMYGRIGDTWLVMTDDGRTYLYMELTSENDWKTLEVFDLNGEKTTYVGSSNDSMCSAPIQTPDAFYLTSRIDVLGTYSAYRKFHVGEDGMPNPDETVYTRTLVTDSLEDEMALVSTRELPATLFGPDGSETNVTLPAGTEYYVRATDLETYVDMELSDGRKCRLAIEKSENGYGYVVDGIAEDECFEFVPYAG